MALIGTISGSVGSGGVLTSATAISGTLIIADASPGSFPTLPSDVKFFVSGVQGAIANSLPGVAVFGGDLRVSGSSYFTDIDVTGHGAVVVQPYGVSAGQTGEVRFKELAANGGNYTALKAADSIAANLHITLPNAVGSNGNVLQTNGSGVTSFVDASSVVTGALSLVSINASSNITGSNLLLTSGFIVTGSGIIESNTSTAAFRVTQQGSGNAITVEDSTNPDSTPFVVTAAGRVGIGTTAPTANLFVTGTDTTIPAFVVKGSDVTVNTFAVTSSAGAGESIGFVNIDQGNKANKYGLTISNVGTGKSGLRIAGQSGGSFAIENMNTTAIPPTLNLTHKGLWFESTSTAYDTSQITYKFIEDNKAVTYTNQKTFLISGNNNGHKTGSYFEVQHSGTVGNQIILQLQGDAANNALFVSGSILTSGSIFISGNLTVTGSTNVGVVVENLINSVGSTGTVAFDTSKQGIFYVNGPTGGITANFTNVPTTNFKVITPTVILSQSATTPQTITAVQIDSAPQTLNWANNTTPTVTAGKQDVFGFSLIRSGSAWKVLGQMSTYG